MEDLAATTTKPPPPLPPPPRSQSESERERHVVFSELPPKHHRRRKVDGKDHRPRHGKRCSCSDSCQVRCAWACLSVLGLILVVLLVEILLIAVLRAELPAIRVQNLTVNVIPNKNSNSNVDVDVSLNLMVSNTNHKVGLSYAKLTLDLFSTSSSGSHGVDLGQIKVTGFSQRPQNKTAWKVGTSKIGVGVDELFKSNSQSQSHSQELVFDLFLSGNMGFYAGNGEGVHFELSGWPFRVACEDVKPDEDRKCHFQYFAFRFPFD